MTDPAVATDEIGWLEAIILGIVQGLTEFLPISSSGHLVIVPAIFGWPDPGAAFTAVTQLGTMAAVVIFFFRDIVRIASVWLRSFVSKDLRRTPDALMGWYVIVGTVPLIVFGIVFDTQVHTIARDLRLAAFTTILFGVLMYAADKYGPQERAIDQIRVRDGVLVGFSQALALIPGVSRSGATMTAGRALGLTREAAARYSFLLSIPAVVLSGVYELGNLNTDGALGWGPTIAATLVAFVVAYLTIGWFLRWVMAHSLAVFAAYRVVIGVLMFVLIATGVLAATT